MRTQINLNKDWQFHLGEIGKPKTTVKKALSIGGPTAALPDEADNRLPISVSGHHFLKLIAQGNEQVGLHDLADTDVSKTLRGKWEKVSLPHDWKYTQPFVNDPELLMSGAKNDDVSYYRKTFTLQPIESGTRTMLCFDGVMRMADVWLNGAFIGHNNSGYTAFSFDISEMLYDDGKTPNVLLVRTDTTTGAEGWWYEGAGIYRDVYLEQYPSVHLNFDDAYVSTSSLSNQQAILSVALSVTNEGLTDTVVAPSVEIDHNTISFSSQDVPAGETTVFKQTITINNPKLWSPETPSLYTAEFKNGADTFTKQFGIHTFKYTTAGFFLNGQPYQLKGVCEHQCFAGVGVALTQDIVDYKVSLVKKMGANAWRSAHHFASPQLLDACDRLGIILINENRILESTPWRLNDLQRMVKKSRMHASVGFWSLANEEITGNTDFSTPILARLASTIKQLDVEHLVMSAELLNPDGIVNRNYLKAVDVLGVNYPEAGVMGNGALAIQANNPDLPIMCTENASYFSTRGIYKDDASKGYCNNLGSMYSMVLPGKRQPGDPGLGGTAHPEEVMAFITAHPEFGGVFLWTAFDYSGEPSPFSWPSVSSQFGIIDSCGFPKDYYYYYQAHWTTAPMIHLISTWNRTNLTIDESGNTPVRIFTNGDEAELFLNGHSLGKAQVSDCRADWTVHYEAGELVVKSYKNGLEVASDHQITSGEAVSVNLISNFEGKSVKLYELNVIDNQTNTVTDANVDITLTVTSGTVLGTGNGDPNNQIISDNRSIRTFNGKALVVTTADTELTAAITKMTAVVN